MFPVCLAWIYIRITNKQPYNVVSCDLQNCDCLFIILSDFIAVDNESSLITVWNNWIARYSETDIKITLKKTTFTKQTKRFQQPTISLTEIVLCSVVGVRHCIGAFEFDQKKNKKNYPWITNPSIEPTKRHVILVFSDPVCYASKTTTQIVVIHLAVWLISLI